jgi:Zn-dependent peptidase ImmA (M78 family)
MGESYNDKEVLNRLYNEEGMKQAEIAEKFGVSRATISRRLSSMGLKKSHKRAEVLRELHHKKRLSLAKMGEKFNVAPSTIHYQMEKNGVEKRTRSEGRKLAALKREPTLRTGDDGYENFVITDGSGGVITKVGHHRLLSIAEHGLDAVKDKVIHHTNGVPWDNRPSNLEIMTDSEHTELHHEQRGN